MERGLPTPTAAPITRAQNSGWAGGPRGLFVPVAALEVPPPHLPPRNVSRAREQLESVRSPPPRKGTGRVERPRDWEPVQRKEPTTADTEREGIAACVRHPGVPTIIHRCWGASAKRLEVGRRHS